MNMTLTPLRKAKGVVLVLVALSLVVLMGMAGLAIDLSHAEVNKTRLQNLSDSLALSAAISLNKQESGTLSGTVYTDKEEYAEHYAKEQTLPSFEAASGNNEVTLAASNFTFTFATTLSSTPGDWQAATAINGAKFARVEMSNNGVPMPMQVATWFARIMGFNNMAVSASAVAGSVSTIPCDVSPVLMCAKTESDGKVDKVCGSDGYCYGYKTDSVYCLRSGASGSSDPTDCPAIPSSYGENGPGNFSLLDVDGGVNDIKDCMAGDPSGSCSAKVCEAFKSGATTGTPTTVLTEPGVAAAVAKGYNTRFDIFQGEFNYDGTYHPDKIVGYDPRPATPPNPVNPLSTADHLSTLSYTVPKNTLGAETATDLHKAYETVYDTVTSDAIPAHAPVKNIDNSRRIVAFPFVKCTGDPGKHPVEVVGFGCFFLTQKMEQAGNQAYIYGEFVGDGCIATGQITSIGNFGIYKVILYKDPFGGHS